MHAPSPVSVRVRPAPGRAGRVEMRSATRDATPLHCPMHFVSLLLPASLPPSSLLLPSFPTTAPLRIANRPTTAAEPFGAEGPRRTPLPFSSPSLSTIALGVEIGNFGANKTNARDGPTDGRTDGRHYRKLKPLSPFSLYVLTACGRASWARRVLGRSTVLFALRVFPPSKISTFIRLFSLSHPNCRTFSCRIIATR